MVIRVIGELDEDTVISRYMSFASFISIVQNKKIFFNAASQFQDKSEGAPTVLNELVNSKTISRLHYATNYALPLAMNLTPEHRKERQENADHVKKKLDTPISFNTPFGEQKNDRDSYKEILYAQRNWLDISCWHEGKEESLAMWKIYGGSTESVCLISSIGRLRESIQLTEQETGCISKIHYIDYKNDFYDDDEYLAPVLHKMAPYAFEKEVRAIIWEPNAPFRTEREQPGRLVNINLEKLISDVKVSPEAKPWFKCLVDETLKRENLPNKVSTSLIDQNPWGCVPLNTPSQ